MANYVPDLCCKIYELFQDGKLNEAEALSEKIISFNKIVAGKYGVAGVKAVILFGHKGGKVRNPLLDCSSSEIIAA